MGNASGMHTRGAAGNFPSAIAERAGAAETAPVSPAVTLVERRVSAAVNDPALRNEIDHSSIRDNVTAVLVALLWGAGALAYFLLN